MRGGASRHISERVKLEEAGAVVEVK